LSPRLLDSLADLDDDEVGPVILDSDGQEVASTVSVRNFSTEVWWRVEPLEVLSVAERFTLRLQDRGGTLDQALLDGAFTPIEFEAGPSRQELEPVAPDFELDVWDVPSTPGGLGPCGVFEGTPRRLRLEARPLSGDRPSELHGVWRFFRGVVDADGEQLITARHAPDVDTAELAGLDDPITLGTARYAEGGDTEQCVVAVLEDSYGRLSDAATECSEPMLDCGGNCGLATGRATSSPSVYLTLLVLWTRRRSRSGPGP